MYTCTVMVDYVPQDYVSTFTLGIRHEKGGVPRISHTEVTYVQAFMRVHCDWATPPPHVFLLCCELSSESLSLSDVSLFLPSSRANSPAICGGRDQGEEGEGQALSCDQQESQR